MKDTKKAEKEIQDILKKNKLHLVYKVSFPTYNILPDEVKLALKVLEKHGIKISFVLEERK